MRTGALKDFLKTRTLCPLSARLGAKARMSGRGFTAMSNYSFRASQEESTELIELINAMHEISSGFEQIKLQDNLHTYYIFSKTRKKKKEVRRRNKEIKK